MRLTNERLQRLTEQVTDNNARNASIRLAKMLLELTQPSASGAGAQVPLPLRLSQGDLAAMTGMCREAVNKQLGIWRDMDWIQMPGGTVCSVDVINLSKFIRGEAG